MGFLAWTFEPEAPLPAAEKADAPGINPKPIVPPAMAESLRKVLLLVDIYFAPEEFDLVTIETRVLATLFCQLYHAQSRTVKSERDTRTVWILFQGPTARKLLNHQRSRRFGDRSEMMEPFL
jgi:hypothetical protein